MALSRAVGFRLGNPAPASMFRRGIGIPVFRCDQCGRIMNQKFAKDYDGLWYCKPYCDTITTPSELDALWAEQQSQTDSWTPNERPPEATGAGIMGINSRVPDVLSMGTSDVRNIILTGFGLSSADVFSFEIPEIAATAVYTGTTVCELEVETTAAPAGDYWFKYGGVTYWRAIKVR